MTAGPIATSQDWAFDVAMTDEQKFIFDLKGWLLIPGVLGEDEIAHVKEHVIRLKEEFPDDSYMPGRWEMPSQALFDHPVVIGVLREILAGDRSEDCYGVRCESSVPRVRSTDYEGLDPHGGPGVGALAYHCHNGQIYSGLTRVVWELNPVELGDGGTLLMSGSHKGNLACTKRTRPWTHLCSSRIRARRDRCSFSRRVCATPVRCGPTQSASGSAFSTATLRTSRSITRRICPRR